MSSLANNHNKRIVERHRIRDALPGAVREALLELQAPGLGYTVDYCGVYVSELTEKSLIEVYDMSEVLEGLVARQYCDHCTCTQVRHLKNLRAGCEGALRGDERAEPGLSLAPVGAFRQQATA